MFSSSFLKLCQDRILSVPYILELTCPGDCNDAGVCDTFTGQCTCATGRHGSDCSSKNF